MKTINKFMIFDSTKNGTQQARTQSEGPNYAEALRLLKNTDAMIQKRKKQLRVQAMRAHRGTWIEQEGNKKLSLREQSQSDNQKTIQAYRDMKRKQFDRIQELKKKGEEQRKESLRNRSRSKMQIFQTKIRVRQQIRLKSRENDNKVRNYRRHNLQQKKSKCLQLYNQLKSSRMHVNDLYQSRVSQIRGNVSLQRDELMEKVKKRKRQLERLNKQEVSIDNQEEKKSFKSIGKQVSTCDLKTRENLPYRKTSSYLKNRKKSISEAKFDVQKRKIVYS